MPRQSTKVARVCEHCGAQFSAPPSRVAKYCCHACYSATLRDKHPHNYASVTRSCERCGKSMDVEPGKLRRGGGRFCSNACRVVPRPTVQCRRCGKSFTERAHHARENAKRPYCSESCRAVNTPPRACLVCGTVFTPRQHPTKTAPGLYCSRPCRAIGQRTRPEHTCEHCGARFISKGASNAARFCSMRCYHNWRTDSSSMARGSNRYRAWREAVYLRDHFTCQQCGQHGGVLNAHHIKGWTRYPALRFDVANGITLCRACHFAHHAAHTPFYLRH